MNTEQKSPALASPAPSVGEPDKCLTCNGHGMIGGLLPGDGGYDGQDCPDCSPAAAPAAPAATEAPSEPTTQQILSLERRSNMSDDEAIRFARAVLFLAARTCAPAVGASPEPVNCEGCNGHGMVGGLRQDGYHSEECPFCKGSGRQSAAVGASVQPVLASLSDEPQVEEAARALYEQWSCLPGYVPWVEGGNSDRQDDARRLARAALASSTPTKGGEAS